MTKSELIKEVATKSGLSVKDTEAFVNAFTSVVTDTLSNGDSVQIVGFGTFGVSERKAHNGINPKTKEKIVIEARKAPTFKAGKGLKDAINS